MVSNFYFLAIFIYITSYKTFVLIYSPLFIRVVDFS